MLEGKPAVQMLEEEVLNTEVLKYKSMIGACKFIQNTVIYSILE
jgi:hypothetical protein